MESNTFLIKQEDCGQRIDKLISAVPEYRNYWMKDR